MFDYETLRLVWWLLIGVLLIGFAITDGFDLGAAMLVPILGKTDTESRVIINTLGPHWDGNQVWFITAAGAIFAAWPLVYATAFSGLYWAMLLVLFALFFRPIGFEYRSKVAATEWRMSWDWAIALGSFVPSFVFGVAFGNLFLGLPFYFNELSMSFYTGSFFALLNPFALVCGLASVVMLTMHGACWLQMRAGGPLEARARSMTITLSYVLPVLLAIAGGWLMLSISGYAIVSEVVGNAPSAPLTKHVVSTENWFANYEALPMLWALPALSLLLPILTGRLSAGQCYGLAFTSSALTIAVVILMCGVTLFPFVMPSSIDLRSSLTLWDATSSHLTLEIMFWVAAVFVPIILAYTSWCYVRMWGRVSPEFIEKNSVTSY